MIDTLFLQSLQRVHEDACLIRGRAQPEKNQISLRYVCPSVEPDALFLLRVPDRYKSHLLIVSGPYFANGGTGVPSAYFQ